MLNEIRSSPGHTRGGSSWSECLFASSNSPITISESEWPVSLAPATCLLQLNQLSSCRLMFFLKCFHSNSFTGCLWMAFSLVRLHTVRRFQQIVCKLQWKLNGRWIKFTFNFLILDNGCEHRRHRMAWTNWNSFSVLLKKILLPKKKRFNFGI